MDSSALHIRAYDPSSDGDIAAVTAIYGHHVLHGLASFETVPPKKDDMASRFAALTHGDFPVFVAEREGNIIGYAYAGSHNSRYGYRFTVEDSIYVAADAMRGGVGKALLGAVISASRERGYRQMIAVIGGPVAGSVALHRSLGFRMIGEAKEVGYKFDKWLDVAFMQLALQD